MTRKRTTIAVLGSVAAVLVSALWAAQDGGQRVTGRISGRVVMADRRDGGVSKVDVIVEGPDDSVYTTTDEAGMFAVEALPPGRYTLVFDKSGFIPRREDIGVQDGEEKRVDVALGQEGVWQYIARGTERMPAPGGWLVRTVASGEGVAITFVPDHGHTWKDWERPDRASF